MIKEERRKKKKRKNILQVILGILIVLALAVLIIFTVFKVKNVEVEGNKLYDAKVIEKAVLNDEYSWNSLYVFLKYKFVNTSEVPFVDTMEIMQRRESLRLLFWQSLRWDQPKNLR